MSNQASFVVAQCGKQIELVSGDFSNTRVGEFFGRDPKIVGPELWKVIKIPTPNQQRLLDSLEAVMGMRNFEGLMRIFDIKVE